MAVGVLLVTHKGIGTALIGVATKLLPKLPLKTEAFEVAYDDDPDAVLPAASAALRRVDDGDGVLVLTDLYAVTPSNVAALLSRLVTPVWRVAEESMPILLRVLNYAELGLDELPAVVAADGRNGDVNDES